MDKLKGEFVGKDTLERLRKTKLYSYAFFISEMRYNQTQENKRVSFPCKIYMADFDIPNSIRVDSTYADVPKMLAEIEIALEWLALKEVT